MPCGQDEALGAQSESSALSSRWEQNCDIAPPRQPFSTQPPRALLPWLLGSSALLCSDTAFPAPQRPPSGMASQAPAAWEPDPGGGGGGGSSERLCLALAGHLTAPFCVGREFVPVFCR